MAKSKRPRRIPAEAAVGPTDIRVDCDLELADWVFLDDGYAVPRTFTVRGSLPAGQVSIDVEVTDKRARSRRVSVSSRAKGGVSSTALRGVRIREVVAAGVPSVLYRADPKNKGVLLLRSNLDLADFAAIGMLVGYVEVPMLDQTGVAIPPEVK